jgi:hypothetical protein
MNISPLIREFTAPLHHTLLAHNIAINSNNLYVNFHWAFTFCIEKLYDRTHLAFGGTLEWHCHFKHISIKQSQFYHCQSAHLTGKGSRLMAALSHYALKISLLAYM